MADLDQTDTGATPAPPAFDPAKPFTPIAAPNAGAAAPPPFDPDKPHQVMAPAPAESYTQDKPLVPQSQHDIETAPAGSWIQTPKGLMQKPEAPKAPEPSAALDYSGLTPAPQPPGAVKSFLRGAETGAGGAAGGLAGFGAGAATGAEIGALGGPLAEFTVPAGALIGGVVGSFGGGWLGNKAQEKVVSMLPKGAQEAIGQSPEQIAEAEQAHPYMFEAGGIAPNLLAFSPTSAAHAATEGASMITRMMSNPLMARAVPAAIMTAQDAVQHVAEGQPIDPGSLALAAGAGALMQRETALGRTLIGMGAKPVESVFGHVRGAPEAIAQAAQQPPATPPAAPQVGEQIGMPIGGVTHPMTVSSVSPQGDVTLTDQSGTNYTMPGAQVARLRTEVPNAPTPQAPGTPPAGEAPAPQGAAGTAVPEAATPAAPAPAVAPPLPSAPEDFRPKEEPALDNLKQVASNLASGRPANAAPEPTPEARPAEAVQQLQQEAAQPGQIAPSQPTANTAAEAGQFLGGAGRGMTEGLYQTIFDALGGADNAASRMRDPTIARAKPFYDQGLIKSPEDLRALVNAGYDPARAGLPATRPAAPAAPEGGVPTPPVVGGLPETVVGALGEAPVHPAEPTPSEQPQAETVPRGTAEAEAQQPEAEGPRVIEGKHTKTGADIVTVQLPQKVGSDEFKALGTQARQLGGYYSSYRGRGALPGFIFKTREAADRFAEMARGEAPKPAEEAPATRAPGWEEIGKNYIGQTLYEDENGARSIIENGVRTTEPVPMIPTRGGVVRLPNPPQNKMPEWQVATPHPTQPNRPVEYGAVPEAKPPTPQVPTPEGTKYVLPSFVTGQPTRGTRHPEAVTADVEAARGQTNPEPTPAQAESGNYAKGKVNFHGLPFVMENPEGSIRRGVDTNGNAWESELPADYGYISKTEGADGDHVDAYMGPHHDSQQVFVVDQFHPGDGFDEHKAMLGFRNWNEARDTYLRAFSDDSGEQRLGNVTPMSLDEFKTWLKEGDTQNPIGPQALPLNSFEARVPIAERQPNVELAGWVQDKLEEKYRAGNRQPTLPFSARELQEAAEARHGAPLSSGRFTRADLYDAMELGVNRFVRSHADDFDPSLPLDSAQRAVSYLGQIKSWLPTQTVRAGEKDLMQQFSTPPDYGYAAAWLANIESGRDRVMEPSAGTGSLVAPAMNARPAEMIVNELSNNRAPLVESLGPQRAFRENAEQLHNILPEDVKPSVVLMNPPFSSAGERMAGRRQIDIGAQHVEQALQRLEPGGRLVAIVGRGMAPDAAHFKPWWNRIAQQYDVRANVGVPGDVYTKYGTSFGTRALIIDKNPPSGRPPVIAEAGDIPDLMNKLAEVRNDRQPIGQPGQQMAGEPGREEAPLGGESAAGTSPPVRAPTGEPGVRSGTAGTGARAGVSPGVGERGTANARPNDQPGADNAMVPQQPERGEPSGAERLDAATIGEGIQLAGSSTGPDGTVLRPAGSAGSVLPASDNEASLNAPPTEAVRLDQAAVEPQGGELTENVYEPYQPQRIKVAGAKEHPGALVQSAAMASVMPPDTTYAPRLDKKLITSGALSGAQLESIAYAGHAHSQMLPGFAGEEPARRGFFLGDGTGTGKGRQVAGIILDNFNQGRTKALWLSEKRPLINDAQRDWTGLGQDKKTIFDLSKTKPGDPLAAKQGVAFLTYDTLKSAERMGKDEAGKTIKGKRRLDQLVDWLGKDFDGVIAFDEAHNMANSIAMKGKRGIQDAAEKALAGVELQEKLPNARVVYVSATGATEVSNLAYAERLGLWGRGTAFPNKQAFISQIHSGGIAAMELVARDMKAMGSYIARGLSYDGVEYDRVEHALSPEQKQIYDDLAGGWQTVLQNIDAALAKTGGNKSASAKSAALSAFWSAHQRFFNQIITSMQMPSVLRAIESDLGEGRQAVLQLVNTNEAAQKRALSKVESDEELEQLDLTPRDQLMQLIEHSFPVAQHETYVDENGNERSRPVTDSEGNVVQNREAVAMREALLDKLGGIRVPEGPLEMLIGHFGADKVAEVTGRKQRVVRKTDDQGNERTVIESRPASANVTEADAFQNAKKPILVFSEAGGTGRSYHADNTSPSADARRSHYLVQAGWRADKAIQGFGRTHRTNQASAPIFHLVTTDLQGQRRFISSIARRLSQLGALTKGERRAGEQGMFSARDNLESTEAGEALYSFFRDLYFNKVPEIRMGDFENQTGLSLTDNQGNLKRELPPIPQFLNRLLSLKYDMQNAVFGAYEQRLNDAVDRAAAAGTLDVGTETLRGDRITKDEDRVVHSDPQSGAETRYVRLKVDTKSAPASFDQVVNGERLTGGRKPVTFVTSKQSGKLYAVSEAHNLTDTKTGNVTPQYRLTDPMGWRFTERSKIDGYGANQYWDKVPDQAQARALWEQQVGNIPEYVSRDVHMITGAILPIWDRVSGTPKVFRTQTTTGERILGRQVDEKNIGQTLRALNAEGAMKKFEPAEIGQRVMQGEGARLANGWSLKRSLVAGEPRLEIVGPDYYSGSELERDGAFKERIGYTTRFFIPTGEKMADVLSRIIERRPVTDFTGGEGLAEEPTQFARRSQALRPQVRDMQAEFAQDAVARGATNPHEAARDWTVAAGKENGNEHLAAYDPRSNAVTHAYTMDRPNSVGISPELRQAINDPDSGMVLHHNHPSDRPPSPSDMKMVATYPGIDRLATHGHGGDFWDVGMTPQARDLGITRDDIGDAYDAAERVVVNRLQGLIDQGKLTDDGADKIYQDLVNRSLGAAGLVDYVSSRDISSIPPFWAKGLLRDASKAALRSIDVEPLERQEADALVNRHAVTVRPEEGIGNLRVGYGQVGEGEPGGRGAVPSREAPRGELPPAQEGLAEESGGAFGGGQPPAPPPPRDPGFPEPDQRKADYDRISQTDNRSWFDRLRETVERIRAGGTLGFRQYWQDQLASLENAEKSAYGGSLAPGRISPTMSARFAKNWQSTLEVALNHNQVRYNPDTGIVETIEGSKPLKQIIGQLADEQRRTGRPAVDDFALWAINKRADRLMSEGRENNVPPDMIERYRGLDQLYNRDDGSNLFQQVHDQLQGWHKNLLDFGEAAGLINPDSRAMWEFDDYVPFYRALGADDLSAPGSGGRGIVNARSPIKRLEGGTSKINNIYENMVLNASALIRRSMANIAAQKARDTLLFNTDALTPLSKEARAVYGDPVVQESLRAAGLDPNQLDAAARRGAAELFGALRRRDPDVISVMDNGKANYYRVNDPLLLQSLTAAGPTTLHGIASLLAAPARLLRSAVVFDPAFMLAHNLRMAQHAFVLTGANPIKSITGAMQQARGIDPVALRLMSAGAMSGKYDINLPKHVRAALDTPEYRNSLIDTPVKAAKMMRAVAEHAMQASDIGPRIAVYQKALSDGASPAEAMDRARDLLDFSTHGAGGAAMFLAQTIPFLNARWQGMARTYRGFMGSDRNAILVRGALMTAATLALWSQNKDDPEYQRKEDWDRQYAWQIKVGDQWFRLPKPFELGALFGTVPELIADYLNNGSSRTLGNATGAMLSNVFKFNPIPVAIKPALEVWWNHDTYTGQPIINEHEQALEPDLQYGPTTSPSVVAATQAFNSVSPMQVAPATVQHLLQGYLAGWGTYVSTAADYLGASAGMLPSRAAPAETPIVGRFLHSEPEPSNRLMDDFYQLKQETSAIGQSIREAEKNQDQALAQRLQAGNPGYNRGTEKEFNRIGTELSRIRGVYQRTEMNPNMTGDQKTQARTTYFNERDKLLDSLKPFLRQAEGLPAQP